MHFLKSFLQIHYSFLLYIYFFFIFLFFNFKKNPVSYLQNIPLLWITFY